MEFGDRKQKAGIAGSSASAARDASPSPKKLTVLVVDDNKVNRKIHHKLLDKLGVKVLEAVNGKEAVELCAAGMIFDLILMDMEMPVMDGPQATRAMREIGVDCKIVGVTGNSRSGDREEFMSAGIDAFYLKPLSRADLMAILDSLPGY